MCLLSQLDRMGLGRKGAALLTWIKQEVKGKRRNESKMFTQSGKNQTAKGIFQKIHLFSSCNNIFFYH